MSNRGLFKSKLLRLAPLAFCAAAPLAIAYAEQKPATEQSPKESAEKEKPRPAAQRPLADRRLSPAFDPSRFRGPLPDSEWEKVVGFMSEHTPNHLKALDGNYRGLKRGLWNRYNAIETIHINQPDVYEFRLKEIELNDQAFGLARELKTASEADCPKLTEKLKDALAGQLDYELKERKTRVERVEKMLATQKAALARDTDRRDKILENRLHRAETHGVDSWLGGRTPGSPGGPATTTPNTAPEGQKPAEDPDANEQ